MEWNQIVGFYYVAKLGGFTKAAESTFRTQSALTHQVKSLETELDCLLFERIGKRKIRLTPAGEKFFQFAESLIEKYNYLIDDLNELKGQKRGQLKLAAPFTTLYHLLPERIRTYSQLHPWVELTLLDRPQQDVLLLLKEGDIDFGLVLESIVPKGLNSLRWKETETVIMVPKGHPLAREAQVQLQQVAQYPLILPPRSAMGRTKLDELFSKLDIKYRVAMESSNVELSSVYTEMGLGVSFATLVKEHPNIEDRNLQFISLSHYLEADYVALAMRKATSFPSYKANFVNVLFGNAKNS
ncbi:HTH-type transcriptional regulator CysB [Peptococcaceae bacterium CEB3]|nr:HTH-type transcriptional regulator CysB [Peptococcaceae bacterium CEB3]